MGSPKAIAWRAPIRLVFSAGPNAALLTLPDTTLWYADADAEVVAAYELHQVLGTDGSAVAADIMKVADGTIIASGTSVLVTTFDLKATVATWQKRTISNGGISQTPSTRIVNAGQTLGINFSGTMTAVAGVNIVVVLQYLREPSW
jgi:hypothetical protein